MTTLKSCVRCCNSALQGSTRSYSSARAALIDTAPARRDRPFTYNRNHAPPAPAQELPRLLAELNRYRTESRKPTAAAYVALIKASADYSLNRGRDTAYDSPANYGSEDLGWNIALGAWEDAALGGIRLNREGLDQLLRFTVLYPDLLPSMLLELSDKASPSEAAYNIIANSSNTNLEQLILVIHEMLDNGFTPSSTLIRQFVRSACEWSCPRLALQLLLKIEENGGRTDAATWVDILGSSADEQYLEGVLEAFPRVIENKIFTPDEGLIIAILNVAGRWGKPDLALQALNLLPDLSLKPQEYHLAPLLESFCNSGQVPKAIETLTSIRESGFTPTSSTAQPIVSVLTTVDLVDHAFYALEDLHKAGTKVDITALNAILEASVRLGDLQRVRATQLASTDLGLKPDINTFNLALSGCISGNHRELGDTILSEMSQEGLQPDSTTYSRIIILCLSQPTYEDAFYYLEKMKADGIRPPSTVYGAMLRKLSKTKDSRWQLVLEEMESLGYNGREFTDPPSRPYANSSQGRRTLSKEEAGGRRRMNDEAIGEKRRQWIDKRAQS